MDRMDIGVDRARLQFQVRTTSFCNVAHAADNDIPASICRVEGCAKRIVAGVAAIRNLDDGAVELVIESIGGEVKGSGRGIEGHHDFIGIDQCGHNRNFHPFDRAILDHISPVSQVSSDFPLTIGRRDRP